MKSEMPFVMTQDDMQRMGEIEAAVGKTLLQFRNGATPAHLALGALMRCGRALLAGYPPDVRAALAEGVRAHLAGDKPVDQEQQGLIHVPTSIM